CAYCIEDLTTQSAERANNYLKRMATLGGMRKAIAVGYVRQELQNAAYDFQQSIDRLEQVVVGVNRFEIEEEKPYQVQRIDEALEHKQVERLRALRAKREKKNWESALKGIEDAARSAENLMPRIIHAVENLAT